MKLLVSKNAKTHNTKPKRKSVVYRLHWVPITNFSRWPCTFLFFGVDFIRVGSRFSVENGINLNPLPDFLLLIA